MRPPLRAWGATWSAVLRSPALFEPTVEGLNVDEHAPADSDDGLFEAVLIGPEDQPVEAALGIRWP